MRTTLSTDEYALWADRLRSGVNTQEPVGVSPLLINPNHPDRYGISSPFEILHDAITTELNLSLVDLETKVKATA